MNRIKKTLILVFAGILTFGLVACEKKPGMDNTETDISSHNEVVTTERITTSERTTTQRIDVMAGEEELEDITYPSKPTTTRTTTTTVTITTTQPTTKETTYDGVYVTTNSRCTLVVNRDGTCTYSEKDDTGTGKGTWWVEGDMIYFTPDNLPNTIYADISDFTNGFFLESESERWNPEYFVKVSE